MNVAAVARDAAPYIRLAPHYDALIGRVFLPGLCSAFEQLVHRYGIRFSTAADVGCGTGLFARWLARRWGVPVYAIDLSRSMLDVASRRATPGVRLLRQDMRRLRLPRPVELITANFDTINHLLTPRDVQRALRACARSLSPGGHLVFDALTPDLCRMSGRAIARRLPDAGRVIQRIGRCSPSGLVEISLEYDRPEAARRGALRVRNVERTYPPAALAAWLRRAGFDSIAMHDASAGTAPPARVIIVARVSGPPD